MGSGISDIPVSKIINGLSANTTYYFSAAGSNARGITAGDTLSFTTAMPSLAVDPLNQEVGDPSGLTRFLVTSNIYWSVASDASWCVPTASGMGNDTIFAAFEANTSIYSRIATLTVSADGTDPVIVTVSQAGATPTLNVSPANQDVTALAGSVNYTVTSNTSWTAQSDSSWCTVTSGSGNGTIIANYTANAGTVIRTAHISVSATGASPVSVNLTQARSSSGIGEEGSDKVRIYPNPNKGIFTVVPAEQNKTSLNIEVEDMNGQSIFRKQLKGQNQYLIDLGAAAGTYNIVIRSDTYVITRKVVIIR